MKRILLFLTVISSPMLHGQEFYTDLDNLKPGTKGYALTVFKGTEPERMELEVVDYIPKRFNAQAMVLIRLMGENVEQSRVAAGMSGSPVYIDGKLLGALAYTWSNSRELIAGVTLIQDMIAEGVRGSILPIPGAKPIQAAWQMSGIDDPEFLQSLQSGSSPARPGLEPTIIAPSSISNGVSPFKPGDAVSIKIADGDISLGSIGTVTHVDGDKVYIYGHPMSQDGTVTLPLAKAKIYTILSSTELSFKMGASTETVGATVFDGSAAVYGRTDRAAPLTAVNLNVIQGDAVKPYNFTIARSPKYLSSVTGAAIGTLLSKELGKNTEYNLMIDWRIRFTNGETVSNSVVWSRGAEYDPAGLKDFWNQYISILWENPVSALVPEDIQMNIRVGNEPYSRYALQDIRIDRYDFLPGETMTLRLALSRPQEGVLLTNLSFTLPQDIKQGRYTLYVGSRAAVESELVRTFLDARIARSEEEILKELRRPLDAQELRVVLAEPESGSLTGTRFLKNVPISRRSLFSGRAIGRNLSSPKMTEKTLPLDRPVTGLGSLVFGVQEVNPISLDMAAPKQQQPSAMSNTNGQPGK